GGNRQPRLLPRLQRLPPRFDHAGRLPPRARGQRVQREERADGPARASDGGAGVELRGEGGRLRRRAGDGAQRGRDRRRRGDDAAAPRAGLLDLGRWVVAVLVQDEACRPAVVVEDEGQLRVHHLVEELRGGGRIDEEV